MSDFHFLHPWHLLGLPLCLALWFVVRRPPSAWYQLMDKPVAEALLVGKSRPLMQLLPWLFATGVLALSGPTWQREIPAALSPQGSVMVLLQQNLGMYAQDLAPSRHQRMQHKLMSLVQGTPGTGFGLIVYDRTAHLTPPLTLDPDFFSLFLEAQSPAIMPQGQGSALVKALALARENLPTAPDAARSILVVADTLAPDEAAALRDSPLPVQVWVVGTERGGTLPAEYAERGIDTRLNVDEFGSLKRDGIPVTLATIDDGDLAAVSANIERAVQAQNNAREDLRWKDSGYLLVIPMLGLLLFWRRQLLCVTLLAGSLGLYGGHVEAAWLDWWATPDQQGQRAFDRQDYEQAAEHFQDPLRRGIAHYHAEQFVAAAAAFRQAPATPETLVWLANSYAQQKSWQQAIDAYDQALSLRPGWDMALDNRARIAGIIMALRKQERDREASQGEEADYDPDEIKHDLKKGQGVDQQDLGAVGGATPQANQWYDNLQLSPSGLLRNLYQADTPEAQ
ncbi:tetratricopeptide repeat protein [Aeromonas taiwanensis]|uniref:tetratricopeptide repeat protein n=1 Tax=Aeromonas taiwanensis TaxID=633417 RepID=UPI00207C2DF8|nr:tetratricopeptide repeat protein [Aeromonas taiwanensis]MCO4204403.1 tetratricopeptide repeat protein [Aeromonas taiwanensis]